MLSQPLTKLPPPTVPGLRWGSGPARSTLLACSEVGCTAQSEYQRSPRAGFKLSLTARRAERSTAWGLLEHN